MRRKTTKSFTNSQKIVKIGRNKLRILFLLVSLPLALSVLSACGAPAATQAPAAPAAPATAEAPVEPSVQYPVQYGQDSRAEIFQLADTKLKGMAASVAVLVRPEQINISGNSVTLDGYTLNDMSEMGWLVEGTNAPMCSGELFTSQPAPGFCTGFLVNDDLLVTAEHCLQRTSCSNTIIVFGFQLESNDSFAPLTKDNIFKCTEVIAQTTPSQDNQYLDYAILKLDRPTGRKGLAYATDDHLTSQDNLAVLGYPSGLPQKIASNAYVMSNDANSPTFVTNLDTFGSNSGSPVINTNIYQVEGILVSGSTDYVLSGDGSCVRVNRCPEGGSITCAGETAVKMTMLAERISENADRGQMNSIVFPIFY
jgi:V8-like Glu-specific endopeptidase